MYIAWPGQNCIAGGARFQITHDTVTSGPFTAGDTLTGVTSTATAIIERVDTSNLKLYCIALSGTFAVAERVDDASGAYATTTVIGAYDAPRALWEGTSTPSTGYAPSLQNYRLSDSATFTVNTASNIEFDRGSTWGASTRTIGDPTMCMISGFSVADYNMLDNSTNLTTILVQGDTTGGPGDGTFTTNDILATITDGSPTYGAGVFGQAQIFAEFDPLYSPAAYQWIRVRLVSSASVAVTIGNIWIGAGTDTKVDESWGFQDGFSLTNINRNAQTELYSGGISDVQRDSIREFSGMGSFNQASFDKFLDTAQGHMSIYNEPQNPLAICFDPDNDGRAVTGSHYFSGLWKYNGNPVANDAGVRKDGVYFWPNVPQRWREHR